MARRAKQQDVPPHKIATEVGRRWAARKWQPTRLSVEGPSSRNLVALVHSSSTPLLIEEPVSARRVNAELAQRVARDAVAVYVKSRNQVAVFLRPFSPGDLPLSPIAEEDLLDCSHRSFPAERNKIIRQIVRSEREKALVVFEDAILACMTPLPPRNLEGVYAATEQEMKFLMAVRWSGLAKDQFADAFKTWLAQLGRDKAIMTVITPDQEALLKAFDSAGRATRRQVLAVLDAEESGSEEAG